MSLTIHSGWVRARVEVVSESPEERVGGGLTGRGAGRSQKESGERAKQ